MNITRNVKFSTFLMAIMFILSSLISGCGASQEDLAATAAAQTTATINSSLAPTKTQIPAPTLTPAFEVRETIPVSSRESVETLLTKVDFSTWIEDSFTVSPDLRKIAFIDTVGDKFSVVLNGVEGKQYDQIHNLTFSPDSQRLAYFAMNESEALYLVLDGIEEAHINESQLNLGEMVFSPDSQRVAYSAQVGEEGFIVVDGEIGKKYDVVDWPTFSPDSKHVVYPAQVGDKWTMVQDEVAGELYDDVLSPVFSPDSQRLAYWVSDGGKYFVVVDGQEGENFAGVYSDSLVFSPDSQQFAYLAIDSENGFVVLNGIKEKAYYFIDIDTMTFSPDSQKFAYFAAAEDQIFVVIDGVEGKPYKDLLEGTLVFSPDSNQISYVPSDENQQYIVVNGIEETSYSGSSGVAMNSLFFSPDSRRLAYILLESEPSGYLVVDGKKGKYYDIIGPPVFSPDSLHIAYYVGSGYQRFVIIDGDEGDPYDYILFGKIIFDSSDSFHYAVLNGEGFFLVEEKINQ